MPGATTGSSRSASTAKRASTSAGGERVADSGGHTVYATPGLQCVIASKWILEATYQYAVYHDLNETQLGEDYRVFGSATFLF